MALYGLAQRTIATATDTAAWEIRSTSTNKPKVMEICILQAGATAGVYGVGRPGAIGVTPTSPQLFVDEADGNAPAAMTSAAVAWGTGPTAPTSYIRRTSCPAAIGAGAVFTFPRGFVLPTASSIVVWLLAASPVCDVSAVVDE